MLLVSIVGFNYLNAFTAFRNMKGEICVDPLISPLSLLHVPSDPLENTSQLARFLQCMSILVKELLLLLQNDYILIKTSKVQPENLLRVLLRFGKFSP